MESVINYFLEQGLLGVIIVMLIGVIVWQQKRLDKKDEEIKLANQGVNVVQEKRIVDSQQNITSFVGMGKDLLNTSASLQKSIDSVVRILELKK